MTVFETIQTVKQSIKQWKKNGFSIGFVPTMGYLHDGHASLIKESIKNNDKTVVSIFVNPTQFGQGEDLDSYPRDFQKDTALLQSLGVDGVFYPTTEEMYGNKPLTKVYVDEMSSILCGKTRPVHFGGVATVVCKLFNIITPHRAYFGSKDFQQLCIIKKMVKDLNMDVEIVGMPIIRDIDGLALSSRNVYLNKNERIAALSLNRSLDLAEKLVKEGETDSAKIIKAAKEIIEEFNETKVDYICIADPDTLENKSDIVGQTIMLLAVYVGKARLIDNRLIKQ